MGGRAVRCEQVKSDSGSKLALSGANTKTGWPAAIITDGAVGAWQEKGGQGQAAAQQSGSVSQHSDAQVSGVGRVTAEAMGAMAKLISTRKSAPYLTIEI